MWLSTTSEGLLSTMSMSQEEEEEEEVQAKEEEEEVLKGDL